MLRKLTVSIACALVICLGLVGQAQESLGSAWDPMPGVGANVDPREARHAVLLAGRHDPT